MFVHTDEYGRVRKFANRKAFRKWKFERQAAYIPDVVPDDFVRTQVFDMRARRGHDGPGVGSKARATPVVKAKVTDPSSGRIVSEYRGRPKAEGLDLSGNADDKYQSLARQSFALSDKRQRRNDTGDGMT